MVLAGPQTRVADCVAVAGTDMAAEVAGTVTVADAAVVAAEMRTAVVVDWDYVLRPMGSWTAGLVVAPGILSRSLDSKPF